ncbi:hypothetical protein AAX19_06860, partial [Oenococcus oeni]
MKNKQINLSPLTTQEAK